MSRDPLYDGLFEPLGPRCAPHRVFITAGWYNSSKSRPWPQEYDSRADQTYDRANKVPSVRLSALDDPKPQERSHDINTAISRIGPPRESRIDAG